MNLESELAVLEGVAKKYAEESVEYEVILRASHALVFVESREIAQQFAAYIASNNQELSQAQKAHLASLGINVSDSGSGGEGDAP